MFGFNKTSEVLPISIFKSKTQNLSDVKLFLQSVLDEKFSFKINDETLEIQTNFKHKKDDLKSYNSYSIINNGSQFIVSFDVIDVLEEEQTPKQLTEKDVVVKQILEFINSNLDTLESFKNKLNTFTEVKTELQKNGVLSLLDSDELIFAYLPIDSLKTDLISVNKNDNFYLLLTSKRKLIVPHKITTNATILELSQHQLAYESKTGKDYIYNNIVSFYTEFFNDSLFEELQEFITKKAPYSIEKFGDILFNRNKLKSSEVDDIQNVYRIAFQQDKKLTSTLKEMLVPAFIKKVFNEDLLDVTSFFKLANHSDFEVSLHQLFSDWKINLEQKELFLNFLIEHKSQLELSTIAPFYTSIFDEKEASKKELSLDFKVNYARFLKDAKLFKSAIPHYESIINSLKNQTVLDMLSDNKADILNGTHASGLQIELLDELVDIKKTEGENFDSELLKLARLQPLNSNRIEALKQVNDSKILEKATVIGSILNDIDFTEHDENFQLIQQTFTKDEIFKNIVPKSYKNAQGIFDTITSLIAQIKPPDYKSVTEFSDKITEDSHPEIFSIINNVAKALSIEPIEYFLGRGNFQEAIIGVESKPNFLIIGNAYLEQNHALCMSKTELQFAVAVELSHILFEHTRITSQDVWRGAKNKSMSLAQVLLIALPALGTISGLIGRFVDITRFKKILTGVDTVSDTIDKGQTVIDYGSKIKDFFTKNDTKEQNLLATSRLMEISADRVGLLMTKDLKSTVSAIFKLDNDFKTIKNDIINKGLYNFLKDKNENNEFTKQNYVIRLKTLFSFYLQTDLV